MAKPVVRVFPEDSVMTSPFKNVEQSFALAKERYAALGVDVDRALAASGQHSDLAALLAGR